MKITCCKDCQGRYVGCHSECEEYIEQKKRLDELRERKHKENEIGRYKEEFRQKYIASRTMAEKNRHGCKRFK